MAPYDRGGRRCCYGILSVVVLRSTALTLVLLFLVPFVLTLLLGTTVLRKAEAHFIH